MQCIRDAVRFSNPDGQAVMWWAKCAPLVMIGLTELPNSGWAKAHPLEPSLGIKVIMILKIM